MVTADERARVAREYLDTVKSHSVSTLPPSVLMREDAELRRLLGQVLDLVASDQDGELDESTTHVTLWGGLYFAPADAHAVMDALSDAAWYQAQHGTAAASDRYRDLTTRIGGLE